MSIKMLPDELGMKAREELCETAERIPEDFAHIRAWLAKQPHLKIRDEEQWLLCFLRGCKFSLIRTKQKLEAFYTSRSVLHEFFQHRDPFLTEIQQALEPGIFLPLPRTTYPSGPRVILVRWEEANAKGVSFVNAMRVFLMIADILMNEDDNFVVAGQVVILDLHGMTVNHALKATPSLCKKIVMLFQDAYPTRLKGLYFINAPPFFENIFNLTKPLIQAKTLKRIHFYTENNVNEVNEIILPHILPREYGGACESLEELTSSWKKKVESYRDWLLDDAQYCSHEDERVRDPCTNDCMFGWDGSFRQLAFV